MPLQRRMRIVEVGPSDDKESVDNTSIQVAFASSDLLHVDQHFGFAKNLMIYRVNPEETRLMEVVAFDLVKQDENEGKLAEKIEILEGCVAVYSQAVGTSAAERLLLAGIQPVKVHDGAEIKMLLEYLQEEMMQGPSTWLAKAITRQKNPQLNWIENMGAESWDD